MYLLAGWTGWMLAKAMSLPPPWEMKEWCGCLLGRCSPPCTTQDIKLMRKIIENKLCNCTTTAAGPCCCRGYGGCEAPRLRPGAAEESEWLLKEYFRSVAWQILHVNRCQKLRQTIIVIYNMTTSWLTNK